MEIFEGKMCVTGSEATEVMPLNTLISMCGRGRVTRVRRACRNTSALYSVDDFKKTYRELLYSRFPELSDEKNRRELIERQNTVLDNILPDPKAQQFFDSCILGGTFLKPEESVKYRNSAMILNAMRRVHEKMYSVRAKQGRGMMPKGEFWKLMGAAMPAVCEKYVNSLPWAARRLKEQAEKYYGKGADGGDSYAALLKTGRYGNQNRTKITPKVERLLVSIYGAKDKPFISEVHRLYREFLYGQIDVVDYETGEIYNREEFYRDGEPVSISETAVWKTLNKPLNRRVVDGLRNDFKYNQRHDVYVKRKSPHYSLSKISFDDRDLCRKTADGKWVHAYYAFDVASGCVTGAAWSLKKDTELIMDCMRDMWKNLEAWNLSTPWEAEVENHLMRELSDKLYNTFMEVTWCAPVNSREKRAEHLIRGKKWSGPESECRQGMAHGRHYAKHEAYLFSREKIFDETNHSFKPELAQAPLEQIIAEDRAQIELYNSARHTNPCKYKEFEGMTRLQALLMRQNPRLAPLNRRVICREWGYETATSLKVSSLFTVQYREWVTSRPETLNLLKSNNYGCQAFWLPDKNGEIRSIYVYQDGKYIDECLPWGSFQEAVAERTEEDTHIMHRQMGRKQSNRKLVRDARAEKHSKVKIFQSEQIERAMEAFSRPDVDVAAPAALPEASAIDRALAGELRVDRKHYAADAVHTV